MTETIGNSATPTVIAAPIYAVPQVNQVNIESNITANGVYVLLDGRYLERGSFPNGVTGPVAALLTVDLYKNSTITGQTIGLAGLHGGLYVFNNGSISAQTIAVYLQGIHSTLDNENGGVIGNGNPVSEVGILLDGGLIYNDPGGVIQASDEGIYGAPTSRTWQYGSNTSDLRHAGPITVFNRGLIESKLAIQAQAAGSYIYNGNDGDLGAGHAYIHGLVYLNSSRFDNDGGTVAAIQAFPDSSNSSIKSDLAFDFAGNSTLINHSNVEQPNAQGLIEGGIYGTGGFLSVFNTGIITPETVVAGVTLSTTEGINLGGGGYVDNQIFFNTSNDTVQLGTIEGVQGAIAFSPQGEAGSRTHIAGKIFNYGLLTTTGTSAAVAVDMGTGGTVSNRGTILASGSQSHGIDFGFGGTLLNGVIAAGQHPKGTVSGGGFGVVAYGGTELTAPGGSGYSLNNAVLISNAYGTIEGGTGVLFAANSSYTGTFTTISGGATSTVAGTLTNLAASTATLVNAVLVEGTATSGIGVVFGGPLSTLSNTGHITGVRNAVLDVGGTLVGTNLAGGVLSASGAYAAALSFTEGGSFTNAGVITAPNTGGIGVVLGGGDTFTGTGSVTAASVGIYGLEQQTITPAVVDSFNFGGGVFTETIFPASTFTAPPISLTVGGQVTATGTGGVGVELVGGAMLTNSGAIATGTQGQAGILLSAGTIGGRSGVIGNSGTIIGPVGVDVEPVAKLANAFAGFSLGNTGLITGAGGPAVQLDAAALATTLTNSATITGSSGVNVVSAVTSSLAANSIYVSNSGLIGATGEGDALSFNGDEGSVSVHDTGTISAAATGIFSDGPLSLTGNGAVEGVGSVGAGILLGGTQATQTATIGTSVLVQGYLDGVTALNTGVSLTNAGSIAGTGTGSAGVLLNAGGTLTNSGRIAGGQYGVLVNGGYGTVAPDALITNTGTILGGADGVYVSGPGTVTVNGTNVARRGLAAVTLADAGLIASYPAPGSTGATFGLIAAHFGSGNDTLLLEPGAAIGGAVVGSDTGHNVIALASGESAFVAGVAPTAGTLQGLGVAITGNYTWQFANFETLSVASGGYLGLGGTNTLGAGATVESAGTVLNAGSLSLTSALSLSGKFVNAGKITGATPTDGITMAAGSTFINVGAGTTTTAGTVQVGVTLQGASTLINGGALTQAVSLGQNSYITLLGGESSVGIHASAGNLRLAQGSSAYGTINLNNVTGIGDTIEYGGSSWTLTGSGDLGAFSDHGVLTVLGTLNASHAEVEVGEQLGTSSYAGALLNYGTITSAVLVAYNGQLVNLPGATIVGPVIGFYPGATVFNYGALEGFGGAGYAIKLRDTGTVVVGPDATFGYLFNGQPTAGAVEGNGSSVLDLVAGPTSNNYGVISGLGSEITGFSEVGVDANAHWQFIGDNTVGAGTVVQNYGAVITSGSLGGGGALLNRNALANFGTLNFGTLLNAGIFLNTGLIQSELILSNSAYLYNKVYAGQTGVVMGDIIATGTGINIINAGTFEGNVTLDSSGGYLALRPGETIDGTVTAQSGNILDLGVITTVSGGVTLAAPGTLSGIGAKYAGFTGERVEAGAAWYLAGYNTLASGTVFNNLGAVEVIGTLVNSGQFNGQLGVGAGGSVTNAAGGVISGEVVLADPGTGTPGGFVNAGQIQAKTGQAGVVDFGGGAITNTDEIQGGEFGVYVAGGVNGDPVTLIQNGGFINSTYGVYFNPSVTNATLELLKGNIKASGTQHLAVDFAGGNDRLELSPNAQAFAGGQLVVASATGQNTIELLSGAGKLSSLGSTYINFTGLQVDTGANWSLSSINSIGTLSGPGKLSLISRSTLTIGAAGSFSGTLTDSGLLDLGASGALGTGSITLNGSATVRLESGVTLANTITDFAATDTIDVRGLVGGTIALNGTALTVGNATTTDSFYLIKGPQNAANLVASSDGAGGTQIVFQSGTLGAAVNVPTLLSFGNVHAGQTAVAGLAVSNGAGPGAASLGVTLASVGAFTGGVIAVAPQMTGTITAGFRAPPTEGVQSATDTLSLSSQTTTFASKSVTLTGTVFSYASPTLSSTAVALGAARVGGSLATRTISLTNGTAADPYREALDVSVPASDGRFVISGGGTVAAGGSGVIGITLPTTQSGAFSVTLPITLASDGSGTSGLGTTALPGANVSLTGAVYAYAQASQPGNLSLGFYHVGQTITNTITLANIGTGSLVDGLSGSLISSAANLTALNSFSGVSSGGLGTIGFTEALTQAGAFSTVGTLVLTSVDAALAPAALSPEMFTIAGTVDNYAKAGVSLVSTAGTLTGSAGDYTLALQGFTGGSVTVGFALQNIATAQADTLTGSATATGSAVFSNAGLGGLAGAAAGRDLATPQITLASSQPGDFGETIVFALLSTNPSSSTTLPDVTINVTGTVTNAPTAITSVTTPDGPVADNGSTNDPYFTVFGTAAPGSTVTLVNLEGGPPAGTSVAGGNGSWAVQYTPSGAATSTSNYPVQLQASASNSSGALLGTSGVFNIEVDQPIVPCYRRGTAIATPEGDVAVESLAIGDAVLTISGAVAAIRWIGRRSYSGQLAAGRRDMLPVCIRASALAAGVPRRDLWVSPLHAMFIDGSLIPARALINGYSVLQRTSAADVHYFHIELAEHDIIWAEGAASETFVDDDSRAMFENAAEYARLYPGDAPQPPLYCAARVEEGYVVERTRRRMAAHWRARASVDRAAVA